MSTGKAPHARAVLYSRAGCGPCFALRRSAERAARRSGIPLEVVDVGGDPDLERRYGTEVPVLLLPGGGIVRGRARPGEVEAAFRSASMKITATRGPVARLRSGIVRCLRRLVRRGREETT